MAFGSSGSFVRLICPAVRPVQFVVSFLFLAAGLPFIFPRPAFPAPSAAGRGMCRPVVSVLALPRGPVCRVPVLPAGGPIARKVFDLPSTALSRGPSGLLGDRLGCAVPCRAAPLPGYSSGFGLLSGVEGWSVAPETEQGMPSASTRAPILISSPTGIFSSPCAGVSRSIV